jgi:hypothetical protein
MTPDLTERAEDLLSQAFSSPCGGAADVHWPDSEPRDHLPDTSIQRMPVKALYTRMTG